MSEDQQCKVSKRLDLKIEDLSALEKLLKEQDLSSANYFCYITSLGEQLKFVCVDVGLWLNEDYNITLEVPSS